MKSDTKEIVIGAGMLGRTLVRTLKTQGRAVTLLNRHGGTIDNHPVTACDVTQAAALSAQLGERSRIYLCAAPAYSRWAQAFPALIEGVCQAVRERQVQIVYADNMYGYGAGQNATLFETTPYTATTVKGRVRAEAAQKLMALHGQGQVQVCISRAADFFGPDVDNSVVGAGVIRSVLAGKPAYLLGNPDLPHSLTYLPDQARCMVALGDQDGAYGKVWHTPNPPIRSLRQFLEGIASLSGSSLQVRTAGRTLLRFMGLFKPDMREMVEMLYLFEQPLVVNHDNFEQRFGLTCTPLPRTLEETVTWAHANG